jgi:hypothetical protein
MRNLFPRLSSCLLILLLSAGNTTAFDLKVGQMHTGAPFNAGTGRYATHSSGFGAKLTMPLGFATSQKTTATLNGRTFPNLPSRTPRTR